MDCADERHTRARHRGQATLDDVINPHRSTTCRLSPAARAWRNWEAPDYGLEGYQTLLTRQLGPPSAADSISSSSTPRTRSAPSWRTRSTPSDVFIVPFESTKSGTSYANFYKLLMRLGPGRSTSLLHVLSNLSRQPGLRRTRGRGDGRARHSTGRRRRVRTCGWLAQVDEHGGSIFHWRPYAKGATDMTALLDEVLDIISSWKTGRSRR